MKSPLSSLHASLLLGMTLPFMTAFSVQAEEVNHQGGFGAFSSIQGEELGQLTGREGMNLTNVQSIQDMKATVIGSSISADAVVSGAITIEAQAMDNYQGVGVFNLLTGHNNAVDAAVGISVYLTE